MVDRKTKRFVTLRTAPNLYNYPAIGLVLGMVALPIFIFLPHYYQQQYGLSYSELGLIVLLAKLIDMLSDPLVGWISDRITVSIHRPSQVFFGLTLLLMGLYQLLFPSEPTVISVLIWLSLTFLGWTWVQVPYFALLTDYAFDTQRRLQLNASREIATVLGLLISVSLPLLFQVDMTSIAFFEVYFNFILITSVFGFLGIFFIKNTPSPSPIATQPKLQISKILPAFRILPLYLLNNLATAMPAVLFILFVTEYLALAEYKDVFLLSYFLSGIIAIPVWLKVQQRLGETKTWQVSTLLASLAFSAVLWLPEVGFYSFLLICIFSGFSFVIDIAIPASLQTKIANDYDSQGMPISGLLFGVWGTVSKLSIALATAMTLPIYQYFQTSEYQLTSLLLLYAFVPIVLKLITWLLLKRL